MKKAGYKILERNFTTRFAEIDIIALDKQTLVFCEVKTRADDFFGAPSEAVTAQKIRKYHLAADEYLLRKKISNVFCRFDVVEIQDEKINHIENAFYT